MNKYVDCLICGSKKYKVLYRSTIKENEQVIDPKFFSVFADARHGQIVSCKQCGLTYVNPREDDAKFSKAYKGLSVDEYLLEHENRELIFEEHVRLIERFINKKGRLLDIGCSAGLFLNVAKSRGWTVKGVEASYQDAVFARREFNLDVINSDIEKVNFGGEVFDVITMWDVLEHLQDPGLAISRIHSILDTNGLWVISTPNINSVFARIMRERWYNIIRMHLCYFNEKSLALFLKKYGFRIIYKGTYKRIFRLNYILKRMEAHSRQLAYLLEFLLVRIFKLGKIKIAIDLHDELTVIAQKI